VSHEYRPIPATTFLMGTPVAALSDLAAQYGGTRESYREESPQHAVSLDAYEIATVPVTIDAYRAYVADGGSTPASWQRQQADDGRLPVVDITFSLANAYAAWLTQRSAHLYRLPTEAEWECAARGTDGRRFPWGDVWENARAATREGGSPLPVVGSFPAGASPWGVLDMAGTVWEWTSSLDALYPYDPHDGREDLTAPGRRIIRGGCYVNPSGYARCACRFRMAPQVTNAFLGFRLVRVPLPSRQ
jgi:toxoflavin biosynthesis protein ToxD